VDGDRVRVVLVPRVAAQLERTARRRGVGLERVGVVAPRAGDAHDPQAAGSQLGRVAAQVAARLAVDELVPRDPDLTSVVGVPVALLVAGVDHHRLKGVS
jgi:hypothetical protein